MAGMAEQKVNINKCGILLFLFGTIVLENGSTLMKIIKFLGVGLAIIVVIRRHYISKSTYIWWLCLYNIYACMTILWAVDTKTAVTMSKTIVLNLLCLWAYVQFVNNKEQYIKLSCKVMTILPVVAFFNLVMEHGKIAFVSLRNLEGEQSALHNGLGLSAAFAICLIIALRNKKNENYKSLILTTLIIIMNLLVVALSGSRKAIIYLVIPLIVFYILKSKNPIKFIRNALLVMCAVIIVYFLLIKVPFFYNNIGDGLQTMIAGLKGNETDASTMARLRITSWGFEMFKKKPFFGYGLENFKILNLNRFGKMYIADNNYIELLVDQGIVGLILYYLFHIHIIRNFVDVIKKNRGNDFLIMLLGIEISILVCDYGVVSYRNMYIQVLICTISMVLQNTKRSM